MRVRVLVISMVLGYQTLHAEVTSKPIQLHSARGLALGGANLTLAEGLESFFYNPAAFNNQPPHGKSYDVSLLMPQITVNEKTEEFLRKPQSIKHINNTEEELLRDNINSAVYARVQNTTGGRANMISFGMITVTSVDVQFLLQPHDLLPSAYGEAIIYNGVALAYHESYYRGRLLLGITGKLFNKEEKVFNLTSEDAVDIAVGNRRFNRDEFLRTGEGMGLGADVGMIWRNNYGNSETRLGAVIKNLGRTRYGGESRPSDEPQMINLGSSIIKSYGETRGTFSFDYNDVLNATGTKELLRTHMGITWRHFKGVELAAGLHQGYPSYGIHLSYKAFFASYAHYAQELGRLPGFLMDKRSAVGFGVGWVF